MNTYSDKSVFITGGGSGIGRSLAIRLASLGAIVRVADLNLEKAEAVAKECGNNASAVFTDVKDASALKQSIESFAAEYGRLDYIFNNAGVGIGGEADEIPLSAWQHVVNINLYGVLHGVLAAYPIMLKQGCGHIINCASLAGLGPAPLLAPYALTKHAVVGLSNSLRIEAAKRGVKVSVLCPSAIETPILDSRNPDEYNIKWAPDLRRFLTALAGPPYPVEQCAKDALVAIEKNKGIIVLPWRARLAWRIGRLSPTLVEKVAQAAVDVERKSRH
jgi:NAD(P)-dependent dehydrogenase (short-subunit alcohol dehydrogenase family)